MWVNSLPLRFLPALLLTLLTTQLISASALSVSDTPVGSSLLCRITCLSARLSSPHTSPPVSSMSLPEILLCPPLPLCSIAHLSLHIKSIQSPASFSCDDERSIRFMHSLLCLLNSRVFMSFSIFPGVKSFPGVASFVLHMAAISKQISAITALYDPLAVAVTVSPSSWYSRCINSLPPHSSSPCIASCLIPPSPLSSCRR